MRALGEQDRNLADSEVSMKGPKNRDLSGPRICNRISDERCIGKPAPERVTVDRHWSLVVRDRRWSKPTGVFVVAVIAAVACNACNACNARIAYNARNAAGPGCVQRAMTSSLGKVRRHLSLVIRGSLQNAPNDYRPMTA